MKCIWECGSAVGWNESKMELGLGCLLAVCNTKNLNVAPGCQWAADAVANAMAAYCPTMLQRVFRP